MNRRLTGALAALTLALQGLNPVLADDQAEEVRNKQDAVDRVAQVHNEVLITGTAALIVKQASIQVARNLLRTWGKEEQLGPGWKEGVPEWQVAESRLLGDTTAQALERLNQAAWVKEIRRGAVASTFDGESADTIATHFESKSGQAQLAIMDWFMGEMTLFNYTYAGRFTYDLKGAEAELKALQRAAQSLIPKKDNELEFSTLNPEAFQFVACSPDSRYCPGVRYSKLNAIAVQGAIIRHIDAAAAEVQSAMQAMRPAIQPYLDEYRRSQ
jgi:CheY-like chemotaxis protein